MASVLPEAYGENYSMTVLETFTPRETLWLRDSEMFHIF